MTKEERKEYQKARNEAIKNGTWKPQPKKAKLTEEEKIAKKKAYQKAWKENNKEKVKASRKAWNEANPDKIKANNDAFKPKRAAYNKANKKKIAATDKAWAKKNEEHLKTYNREHLQKKKLPFNIVYCIPDYDGKGGNYAGVTNNPHRRMLAHKNDTGKLNTENWFILDVVIDRGEALISESRFHVQGYHGAMKGRKYKQAKKGASIYMERYLKKQKKKK